MLTDFTDALLHYLQDLSDSFVREEGRSGDEVNTIQELLEKLGLQSFQPVFDREHIDMDTLVRR